MARASKKRQIDQGPGLWDVEDLDHRGLDTFEAELDDVVVHISHRLGVAAATVGAPDEPRWFAEFVDTSWPRVLAEADADDR